jgi:hypothetical protein
MKFHTARQAASRLALGLLMASAVALPAAAGTMAARFGNTLVGTRPDGMEMKLYFKKDNTFDGKLTLGFNGRTFLFGGTWRQDGDKLCTTQTRGLGPEKGVEKCGPIKGDKPGDSWVATTTNLRGQTVQTDMKLVEGHH